MARCEQHPLEQAHSPLPAQAGHVVYVVCGWQGCQRRRQVVKSDWSLELRRRAHTPPGPPPIFGELVGRD
jgi:hypothetical protein